MDNENVERLIECVRRHEFLYDLSNKDYKNITLKTAVWDTIGRELNQTGEFVKNKWKTIRDGYTKHKKQIKGMTGSSKKSAYYTWASQLSFLDNFNALRVPYSSVEVLLSVPPRIQTPNLDCSHSQDLISPANSSLHPSTLPPPLSQVPSENVPSASSVPMQSRGTKRNQADMTKVLNILHKKKKKDHDGIDHLFLSYADTFKKFPLQEQALLKLELAKLFTNTELRLLQYSNDPQTQYASSTSPAYSSSSVDNIGDITFQDNNSPPHFPAKRSFNILPVDLQTLNNTNSTFFEDQRHLLQGVKKEGN